MIVNLSRYRHFRVAQAETIINASLGTLGQPFDDIVHIAGLFIAETVLRMHVILAEVMRKLL